MKTPTLVSASIFAGAIFAGCGCSKKEEAPPAPVPTAEPTPAPAAAPPTPAAPAGFGTVEGSIAFTGTAPAAKELDRKADPVCAKTKMNDEEVVVNDNKTLRNVLVRIKGIDKDYDAPADEAKIEQTDCMYRPRVSAVVAGQTIAIKNGDQTLHNVHTYRGEKTLFNMAQPPNMPDIKQPMKKGDPDVIRFKCDVHPWMTAHVLVSNHPFFAVTGEDGKFSLKNVPAGRYTVEAWHEKFGVKTVEVTVEPDRTAAAEFSYAGTETM
jgi:plastocyanin